MVEPKRKRGRPRGSRDFVSHGKPLTVESGRLPNLDEIEEKRELIKKMGYDFTEGDFQRNWREHCERNLFVFAKTVLDYRDLTKIHEEAAAFLTNFEGSRRKLLMMPVGFLKTSLASHALPLHVLIQHPASNLYFRGQYGADQRILLANESENKCKENLAVIASHLLENKWIAWMWPGIVWHSKNESPRWNDMAIQVPRARIRPEPSVTAIGVETGLMGRHYDVEILDDIATLKAGMSEAVMGRARQLMRAARSRLQEPFESIEITVATHQSANDIFLERRKDPTVDTMRRAIEEKDPKSGKIVPAWPERYPADIIERLRQSVDPVVWALWYMNQPAAMSYIALDWEQLREFIWVQDDKGAQSGLMWAEDPAADRAVEERALAGRRLGFRLGGPGANLRAIKGNFEQMRSRFGTSSVSPEMKEHMIGKYGDKGPEIPRFGR